jgi:Domain of unknown function (DUF4160)
MPEVSRFYGIVIRMYFGDHPPAHFHAEYGEHEALVSIEQSRIIAGDLPSRAFSLVQEWTMLHQQELQELWEKARQLQPLTRIKPLD